MSRNPRQVSDEKIERAIAFNKRWARHFADIYGLPDVSELESIGLESITKACVRVRKTQRHTGFLSLCRKIVHDDIIEYVREKVKTGDAVEVVRCRMERIARDPDRYMPEDEGEG